MRGVSLMHTSFSSIAATKISTYNKTICQLEYYIVKESCPVTTTKVLELVIKIEIFFGLVWLTRLTNEKLAGSLFKM